MKYDQIVKAVRERAELEDPVEAERTLRVVIQALSDRLIGGEADDMLAQLPEPLKSEIVVTEAADPMHPDEFVERVARDLGLPEDEARERVRVVFATLRESMTEGEWEEVVGQLNKPYARLLA